MEEVGYMRHKLDTVVFSQGWLEGQIENMVAKSAETADEDPTAHLVTTQISEQWAVVSTALDDLIQENLTMRRKLDIIKGTCA